MSTARSQLQVMRIYVCRSIYISCVFMRLMFAKIYCEFHFYLIELLLLFFFLNSS